MTSAAKFKAVQKNGSHINRAVLIRPIQTARFNIKIRFKYGKSDLDIQKLDYASISEFEFWLKSQKSCGHNTVTKYLTNFKKIVVIYVKNGWLNQDPFASYRMSREVVNRSVLTEVELSKVARKDFENERLNQVRNIFVFSCFAGLLYIDVYHLSKHQIIDGINDEKWLVVNREKTDSESRIPLLPLALQILENMKIIRSVYFQNELEKI